MITILYHCLHYDLDYDLSNKNSCSAVYNCVTGPFKNEIPLVSMCVLISNTATYAYLIHASIPAIQSINCTNKGLVKSPDDGIQCVPCQN